ncbi:MAG: hypothetical protein A2289_08915 [Deltaproteobacteria bacterium RIFOXYA12_FULL_58_15]|nr:MAG: hypothetical protein A2289_08915 [Deltaproteobacteria bacterium RIFOXYA12_FULL_58_15]
MRKPKASKRRPTQDERELEAQWEGVDFDKLKPVRVDLDPAVRERVRRDTLVQLTLRLGEDQIAEAKRVAKETNEKYQQVLRRWVAEGASRTQTKRRSAG